MDRQTIIQKVQLRMDEISPYDSGEIINNSFIDEILNDSVTTLLLKLPTYLCNPISMGIVEGVDNSDGTGYIELPDDFLRLVSFKMVEWSRAVTKPISEDSPQYNLQKISYLRGKPTKPVVVIRNDYGDSIQAIKKILEYYSVVSDHDIERALYIKTDVAENLPDNIIDALAYQCASDGFVIMEKPDQAKIALVKVDEFIQLNTY